MKNRAREYLRFALALFCLFAMRSSLADHYFVPSGSMERTLFPGDRVAVDKRAYGLRVPFRWFGFVGEDGIYAQAVAIYYRAGEGFVWLPL